MRKPKFVVLVDFGDLDFQQYRVGDIYPKNGYEPTDERIEQLTTNKNNFGKPVVKQIEEEVVVAEEDESRETIKKSRR